MSLPDNWEIALFSKHLQKLSLATIAELLPQTGINALDLTVRPGGHIEPADAAEKLPAFCDFFQKHNGKDRMNYSRSYEGPRLGVLFAVVLRQIKR